MVDKLPPGIVLSPLYPEEQLKDEPIVRKNDEPFDKSFDSDDTPFPTSIFKIDEGDPWSSFIKCVALLHMERRVLTRIFA